VALGDSAAKRKAALETRKADHSRSRELNRAVGRAVGIIRRQFGISMDEFAEQAGWHRSKQSKIEGGKQYLSVGELVKILGVLGILDVPEQPEKLVGPVIGWILSSKSQLPLQINPAQQLVIYTADPQGRAK
jgi:transcriptional regulator with XRE-family HTH domain